MGRKRTIDALARAHLVLPLRRHHFSVDARNLDPRVQTGLVMRLDNVAAVHLAGADAAVVRALRAGEPVVRPAVRPVVRPEQGVLLLQPKPELLLLVGLEQPRRLMPVVELVRRPIRVPGLAHHQDVVAQAQRIWEDGHRADVHVGVVTGRLARRRAIKIPFRQVRDRLGLLVKRLSKNEVSFGIGKVTCLNSDEQRK